MRNQIALHIISVELGHDGKEDYAIWNTTEDGHFTNGLAWNLIRRHMLVNGTISNIWHKLLPLSNPSCVGGFSWVEYLQMKVLPNLNLRKIMNTFATLCIELKPCNMFLYLYLVQFYIIKEKYGH